MTITELKQRLQDGAILKNMMTDDLLEAFLTVTGNDVEAAFQRIKRYIVARQMHPGLMGQVEVLKKMVASGVATFMTSKTPSGESVMYFIAGNWKPEQATYENFLSCIITILEHKALECASGVYLILDQANFGMKHMAQVTPKPLANAVDLFNNVLPVKMIRVLSINSGFAARAAWKVVSPFLPKQTTETTLMLGKDNKKLHELVAPQALPDICGGTGGHFDSERYLAELQADEQALVDKWNAYQV
ncbi:Clavesin-1 [Halotydeus destructor]|nr:Clavesin-1 [Halotydeus destructor]KAI1297874.1 Clavesin-1 [Halotydeus destructor]